MSVRLDVASRRSLPGRVGAGLRPLVRQPILVFAASGEDLTRTLSRARERGVRCCIYTHDLFATGNDADNRAAVEAVATEGLDLVGLALHAERKEVDKVTKGLRLHPLGDSTMLPTGQLAP